MLLLSGIIVPAIYSLFGIVHHIGINEKTQVTYNVTDQTISIDRRLSGLTSFSKSFPGVYTAPLRLRETKKLKLHILVDQCSVEVFCNDGETTLTCQVFPNGKSLGIEIYTKGGTAILTKLDAWSLLPFWEENN